MLSRVAHQPELRVPICADVFYLAQNVLARKDSFYVCQALKIAYICYFFFYRSIKLDYMNWVERISALNIIPPSLLRIICVGV